MSSRVRDELVGMIDRALGDDPKGALIASLQLKREIAWLTERSVALARREGYDWGKIGRLLGVTRQSARLRFKSAPPRMPPHVVARNRYLAEERKGERMLREFRQPKRPSGYDEDGDDGDVVAW
ncbi:MAG: hypothetical protein ABI949_17525 [Ilumatobacteraceae bacterium]